jgi:4-hydroxy-tetrahydrodipicolinate synthase
MNHLEGIFPILNTPFHEDGSVDLDSQARLVEHLLAAGAHGFGLFGNASEGYTLLAGERREILKLVVRLVGGRVPLVVSSGHTGTDGAVALSREAQDLGASALMVLPPFFLKTDGDGLMHYFAAISEAVSIPIMIQDAPLMTQVAMPAPLLVRMGREIERVQHVKVEAPPTAPKVSAIKAAGGPAVFGGLNCQFMIEEIQRGARGMMPGSDLTPELVRVWNLLQAGGTGAAWEQFTRILPLLRFELQPGLGVSAMKHNLAEAGIIRCARVRHPTAALDSASLAELAFLREFVRSEAVSSATGMRP